MTRNNLLKMAMLFVAALSLNFSFAQLQLPAPSPKASVMQRVGLTDITIDYSSPAVNGRVIWGGLLAYDNVWRAGANAATKMTFSEDVSINGKDVAAGSYSFFVIPSKAHWTLILNKDASASEGSYKSSEDIVRVQVTPVDIPTRERLAYSIVDFDNNRAIIRLEWEKKQVSFDVKVATDKQAEQNISKTLGGVWGQYNNTARYYLDNKNYDKALEYVNTSIDLAPNQWFNNWVKAQALAGKGDTKSAYDYALRAQELGNQNPGGFFFKAQVDEAVAKWKPATPAKKGKK